MESVSTVIPTYNRAHFIARAITSVLINMQPGDELIVVDDGSTDNTEEAIRPFRDRIRYVRTENRGVGPARNRGVSEARNPLVAFLDSDDEWMPGSLDLKRAVMNAFPDVVFCFTDFANKSEDGTLHGNYLVNWHHDYRSWDEILGPGVPFSSFAQLPPGQSDFYVHIGDMYPLQLQRNYVAAWTSVVRRSIAGADFRNAEDLVIGEEWECYGKIAKHGRAAFLACDTAWNHGHSGPRVTTTAGAIGILNGHLQIAQRIWGRDQAFLAQHGELYRDVIADIHLQRARWYVSRGMTREARADLAAAGTVAPRSLKLLAGLPGWLLTLIGDSRRVAINLVKRGK